jgi:hypothetical protein
VRLVVSTRRGVGLAAAGLALAAAALAGCGPDERTFSAEEFVREANGHGADLELGEPLSTSDPNVQLYALITGRKGASAPSGVTPQSASAGAPEGTAGSLRVTESSDAAESEFDRCEQAGLLCFRAANVVAILQEEAEPAQLTRLRRAVRAMKTP